MCRVLICYAPCRIGAPMCTVGSSWKAGTVSWCVCGPTKSGLLPDGRGLSSSSFPVSISKVKCVESEQVKSLGVLVLSSTASTKTQARDDQVSKRVSSCSLCRFSMHILGTKQPQESWLKTSGIHANGAFFFPYLNSSQRKTFTPTRF